MPVLDLGLVIAKVEILENTATAYKLRIYTNGGVIDTPNLKGSLGTDILGIVNGGTGASTAEGARENLGVPSNDELEAILNAIDQLKGYGGYLTAHDFGELQSPQQPSGGTLDPVTDEAMDQIFGEDRDEHGYTEIFNGTRIVNLHDNHTWVLNNTPESGPPVFDWSDIGVEAIGVATEETLGLVKSGGDVEVDPLTGEMSVASGLFIEKGGATADPEVGTAAVRNISTGTDDMDAGTTGLSTGALYLRYE
jgi:hypothetical protein